LRLGVAGGVAAVLLAAAWFVWNPRGDSSTASEAQIRSLAVLPFENVSRDPDEDYFVDGMTEALISDLARIRSLKVISRTSVMRYKATNKSIPEIARS